MASNTETGHAKNIANLKKLNEINNGFGGAYNPSNALLGLGAMQGLHTDCDKAQEKVNEQAGIFKPLVNARQDTFKPVKPLVRRVRSSVKVSGASDKFLKDVNTVVTKILGERASKATPTEKDPAGTSASQQSYDNTVNNMDALVELLKNEPLYTPNENDLKVSSLENVYNDMDKANNKVKEGVVPYNNAILNRNKLLYTAKKGLCDVGQASKDYVRSTFGFSSPEFKLVSKIKFTKLVKV